MATTELFVNATSTVVVSGGTTASGGDNTFTVSALNGFPVLTSGQQFRIVDKADPSAVTGSTTTPEIMLVTVTGGAGNLTWTVTRGAEGTTPIAHHVGWTAVPVATSGALAGFAARYVPLSNLSVTASASGYNVVENPSNNQVDPTVDVATIFGGTAAYPHVVGPGVDLAVITGGYGDVINNGSIMAVISGAHHLVNAPGGHGTISGGSTSTVYGDYGSVGGGLENTVLGLYGHVGGGRLNVAGATTKTTLAAPISVGDNSLTVGTVSGLAIVNGMGMMVGFGATGEFFANITVSGSTVTLPGGSTFALAHAANVFVTFTDASATDAVAAGGYSNQALGLQSVAGGGFNNHATGGYSTVGGGTGSIASGIQSTVGGGNGNVANGSGAAIAGGLSNTASGLNGAIGGGTTNTASGSGSGVPYGSTNTASGSFSGASGFQALASLYGESSHSSGDFATAGDAGSSELVSRAVISGATTAELFLDQSAARLVLPNNTGWRFVVDAVAWTRAASGTVPETVVGAWRVTGSIYQQGTAASTTLTSALISADDSTVAGFGFTVAADGTHGALGLSGTTLSNSNCYFVARTSLVKVAG